MHGDTVEDDERKEELQAALDALGETVDVSEVFSPGRFTSKAQRYGLRPGTAFDLTTYDPADQPLTTQQALLTPLMVSLSNHRRSGGVSPQNMTGAALRQAQDERVSIRQANRNVIPAEARIQEYRERRIWHR